MYIAKPDLFNLHLAEKFVTLAQTCLCYLINNSIVDDLHLNWHSQMIMTYNCYCTFIIYLAHATTPTRMLLYLYRTIAWYCT